jgi:hypothetical protein
MLAWCLVDGRDPVDRPDDFPTKPISGETELRQELDRRRHLEVGIVSLQSPTGEALQIGIGGPFAGLRWFENPHSSEKSRDLLADGPYCSTRVDFLAEGDTIAFWPEHLMPVDQVVEIAVYFFKHARLPDWVAWKEWDGTRKKWHIQSAIKVRSA